MDLAYDLFIETLNLVLLPVKESGASYRERIQYQLGELEGDAHSFLHKNNIQKLVESGHIPAKSAATIEVIWTLIGEVDAEFWSPFEFVRNSKWIRIRDLVVELFLTEGV